jgi:protein-tyrosine phosphatase
MVDNPLGLQSFGIPPSQIANELWVGNAYDLLNTEFIVKEEIRVLISLLPQATAIVNGVVNVLFPVPQPFNPKNETAEAVIDYITKGQLRFGNVLLCCLEGIDRSPTIALGWLVYEHGWNPTDAENRIKEARPIAKPHRDWIIG